MENQTSSRVTQRPGEGTQWLLEMRKDVSVLPPKIKTRITLRSSKTTSGLIKGNEISVSK